MSYVEAATDTDSQTPKPTTANMVRNMGNDHNWDANDRMLLKLFGKGALFRQDRRRQCLCLTCQRGHTLCRRDAVQGPYRTDRIIYIGHICF